MSFHTTALQYAIDNFDTIWETFEANAKNHKDNYIITYLEWQTNKFSIKTTLDDDICTASFFGDRQTPYNNTIFLFSERYGLTLVNKQSIKNELTNTLNTLVNIESKPDYQPSLQIACTKKALDNFENLWRLISSVDDIGYGILVDVTVNPKTSDIITSVDYNETSCYFRDIFTAPLLKYYRDYDGPLNKQHVKEQLEYELNQLTTLEEELNNALPLPTL